MGFPSPTPNQELQRIYEQAEETTLEVNRRMLNLTKGLVEADMEYSHDNSIGGSVALEGVEADIHELEDFMSIWIAATREGVRAVRQQENIKVIGRSMR